MRFAHRLPTVGDPNPNYIPPNGKKRCRNALPSSSLRCTLKQGHISDCDFEPAEPAKVCTCQVSYELAPHPCELHGAVYDFVKPERKRFKVPKPAPMSNMVPASDYVIAQRMAKIQEKLYELKEAYKDHRFDGPRPSYQRAAREARCHLGRAR